VVRQSGHPRRRAVPESFGSQATRYGASQE
jgi:hypothetical protein